MRKPSSPYIQECMYMYIQKVEKVFYVVQNLFKILLCVSSFLTEPLKTDDFCGRPNRKKNPVDF